MDKRAIQSLKGPILAFLKRCELAGSDYRIRDQKSESENALRAKLEKVFGEVAWPWVLQREIESQFKRAIKAEMDITPKDTPAIDVLTNNALEQHTLAILNWLSTIPRKYSFYVPLSSVFACNRGVIDIFEDLGFFEPEHYAQSYDPEYLTNLNSGQFDLTGDTPVEGVYLRLVGHGYFTKGMEFGALPSAMSRVKQFLFLTVATDNAFTEFDDVPPQAQNMTGFVVDHESDMGHAIPFVLPPTIQRGARDWNLYPWWADDEKDDEEPTVAELEEFWKDKYESTLHLIRNKDEFESILTACEWAFDAWYESNETVSYIFLAIAFESLLGSNAGESNISGSLANSLAKIARESHQEEDEIRNKFKKFYQIRSKIAHGKRSSLEPAERESRYWGMNMFVRVLKKELSLISPPQ